MASSTLLEHTFEEGVEVLDRVPLRESAIAAPVGGRPERPRESVPPLPVRVWINTVNGKEFEAAGEALAWTAKQVRVRYEDPAGREGFAWVWASAVTRRDAGT